MSNIILDRSRLEQYATCPQQAYLSIIFDCLGAEKEGYEVFEWERQILEAANKYLIQKIKDQSLLGVSSRCADIGTQIHDLIERAYKHIQEGDSADIAEYFTEVLPKSRPDIQPHAIVHARHAADMIANMHLTIIGLEHQVSFVIRPGIELTMRFDILGSGRNNLHVIDWKTGWKRRTNTEAATEFQSQFGAWILWQQPEYKDIDTIHFWFYETRWGSKAYAKFRRDDENPRLPALTTELAITNRVLMAVELFSQGCRDAWPLPKKCCYCDMIQFCEHAHNEAKQIADDPKGFVDNLVVLTEHLKKMKEAATAWIKTKGPLEGSKVIFDRKKPSTKFSAEFTDKDRPKGPATTGDDDLDSHFG